MFVFGLFLRGKQVDMQVKSVNRVGVLGGNRFSFSPKHQVKFGLFIKANLEIFSDCRLITFHFSAIIKSFHWQTGN